MFLKVFKKMFKPKDQDIVVDGTDKQEPTLTVENLQSSLGASSDVKFREVYIAGKKNLNVTILFVDGLIDNSLISNFILKPLMEGQKFAAAETQKEVINLIEEGIIYYSAQEKRHSISEVISDVLTGSVALIFDKQQTAFTFEVKGFEKRSISEPSGENVIKGAKDSFIETLRVNTATVRTKIKSQNLIIEQTVVGRQTLTPVAVVYMNNIANKNIVDEVKKRLNNIDVDGALTTAIIEEYIIDSKLSTFPQVITTERPDKFCSNIIEGRVGIIIDGLFVSMIVPATLLQFLQAPEDYTQNFYINSLIRLLRFTLMVVTLFFPGFYISITSFHPEMIPTELALSIELSKEGVPFPSFLEVIIMLIAFEVLVEAGIRLPKSIGQAVSIVGALVVGEAAVSAKIVSPAVVIVIAITAIASFATPNQDFSNTLRLWRFIIVILSSIVGLFGLSMGSIFLLYHISKLEVLGVPYLSPFAAAEGRQIEDSLFRFPMYMLRNRPISLRTINKKRRG